MTTRTVMQIEKATTEFVGANKVKRALPTRNLKQVDPFLFIDHMGPTELLPAEGLRIPPHPHAGFEVVTYIISGEMFHRDSFGHNTIANAGDLNWMTSGAGIIHSEGPSEAFSQKGGNLELIQVWINLPAAKKNIQPSFRRYPALDLPVIQSEKMWLKVILGEYNGKQSPVITHTPMFYYHLKAAKNQLIKIPVAALHSAALYILNGQITVLNEEAKAAELVHFNTVGDNLVFNVIEDVNMIVFGGLPIKEKVVSYGPFVMNSFEEIQHVIADYETGKMGHLEF